MSRMSELLPQQYPSAPGFKEPTTSRDAAKAIQPRVSELAKRILALLVYQPMTPDEAAKALDESLLTIRPRFSELNKLGMIEKTGARRANSSGLKAYVWRKAL